MTLKSSSLPYRWQLFIDNTPTDRLHTRRSSKLRKASQSFYRRCNAFIASEWGVEQPLQYARVNHKCCFFFLYGPRAAVPFITTLFYVLVNDKTLVRQETLKCARPVPERTFHLIACTRSPLENEFFTYLPVYFKHQVPRATVGTRANAALAC